jgi:hypothetical protein
LLGFKAQSLDAREGALDLEPTTQPAVPSSSLSVCSEGRVPTLRLALAPMPAPALQRRLGEGKLESFLGENILFCLLYVIFLGRMLDLMLF